MSEKKAFDLIVIGAGPGGYVAAMRGAQRGLNVALIDKDYLGGTCLNRGCIPTKTLLANAGVIHKIRRAEEYGVEVGPLKIHYDKMKQRKDDVVQKIRTSLQGLITSNGITIYKGTASFLSPKEIKVRGDEPALLKGEKIIIATGSETLDIPAFPCDNKKILNSTSILEITSLPQSIAIIGGGYIGCEFASLFAELGVKVTIVEALESILQAQGNDISQFMSDTFSKKGIELKTKTLVESIDTSGKGVSVHLKGDNPLKADLALVAAGRRIYSDGLELKSAGIPLQKNGAIAVNDRMETEVSGIYAIGDVTGIAMLAHVASHQGIVAAENAAGYSKTMHYNAVPAVVFTEPEIATCGMTLEEAHAAGYKASKTAYPFQALGKSQATLETEGFAQIIVDTQTGQLLGAQVIGHEASSLIAEMAIAISNELTLACLTDTIHAHPTIAECWLEAGAIAEGHPIHFPPKAKK